MLEQRVTGVRVVYVADPRKLALATSRIEVANLEPLEDALGKRVLKLVA